MYWPSIGTVKSRVVPEETRATIYNIYRVPLNAIVLGVLLNHISTLTALTCCGAMLFVAFVVQRSLVHSMAAASAASSPGKAGDPCGGLMSGSDDDRDY